ncbi:MAG: glycosyltransferase family 2 protein [Isosphaeraceae bacterium]|nr:glycosyltransferase family 2 protein [Isosphaeraceae bacterium]
MMTALLVMGAAIALFWWGLVARLLAKVAAFRPLAPEPWPTDRPSPSIAVIVPAHNEEAEVEATVSDILAQDQPALMLTVVDDQSTDATGAILDRLADAEPRLHAIHGESRPAGWVGKTWALHQGVRGTSSDWILFIDADMRLHPSAVSTALLEAERTGADMVSFLPKGECRTFWQTATALTLGQVLGQLYPLDAVNDPKRPEALAAGGFILIRRAAYERLGGHEAVRSEIVDDILLARRLKAAGGRLICRSAPDLASTHLYGSVRDIYRGLRKNAYAGMEYQPHKYVFGVIVAALTAWVPWICLVAGVFAGDLAVSTAGVAGVLGQVAVSYPLTVFLGVSPLAGLSLPLGISLYIAIATASVRDYYSGRIIWKGRAMAVDTIFATPPSDAP